MKIDNTPGLNDQGELVSLVHDNRLMYNILQIKIGRSDDGGVQVDPTFYFPTMREYDTVAPVYEEMKRSMRKS